MKECLYIKMYDQKTLTWPVLNWFPDCGVGMISSKSVLNYWKTAVHINGKYDENQWMLK